MEFENLQIEVPLDDESESQYYGIKVYEKKYENKSKNFVVGFNPKSKEFVEKKVNRAKRFGLNQEEAVDADTKTDLDLFKDINLQKLQWPLVSDEAFAEIRADAILLNGVNEMSTKDVFEYFKLFGPESLEWIDDSSCNVVWDDEESVQRALDGMSKTYGMLKKHQETVGKGINDTSALLNIIVKEEIDEDTPINENEIEVDNDIYPKDVWRIGVPFKTFQLFLRPATIMDKKLPDAAKRSAYYLKYGKNANTTNSSKGIVSKSRKRKIDQMKKTAHERYRNKEPDVKICDLDDLKREGLVHKMEVDNDDEPAIKRLNTNCVHGNSMTMIADRVELGDRFDHQLGLKTVHDRLGSPNMFNDTNRHSISVHDRLGGRVTDHMSKQNKRGDARHDIQSSKARHKKVHESNDYGYEDDDGIYHDIYQADHVKTEDHNGSIDENDSDEEHNFQRLKNSDRYSRTTNDRNLNKTSNPRSNSTPDLRNKLKGRSRSGAERKGQHNSEKVNLCIEIKQEIDEDMEDEDFEF